MGAFTRATVLSTEMHFSARQIASSGCFRTKMSDVLPLKHAMLLVESTGVVEAIYESYGLFDSWGQLRDVFIY